MEPVPRRWSIDFRARVRHKVNRLSAQDRCRLDTTIIAIRGHEGRTCDFVEYHHIRSLRRRSSGWTFVSEFEFVHRTPFNGTPITLIVWNPTSIYEYQLPLPLQSPIPHHKIFRRPRGEPYSWN